jgi:glycosyltransferase involved in cell wall biosynthesis
MVDVTEMTTETGQFSVPKGARSIAVFANASLNLIDGSSIWVQSVVLALAQLEDVYVHLILRDHVTRTLILDPLINHPSINIVYRSPGQHDSENTKGPLDEDGLVAALESIDSQSPLTGVLVRGNSYGLRLCNTERFSRRLWAYILDRPPLIGDVTNEDYVKICKEARFVLAQSEPQRALIEARIAEANGKVIVLPPIVQISAELKGSVRSAPAGRPVKLVYSGKYSKLWNVESYFDLPVLGKDSGLDINLVCIGDKVHKERSDPNFYARIMEKLESSPGTTWLKGLARKNAMEEASKCDFGLCWRLDALNNSIEVSTKFLEFASLGIPVFVNRTETYEDALGADYPFFTKKAGDVIDALGKLNDNPQHYEEASRRCLAFSTEFSLEKASQRLKRLFDLSPPAPREEKKTAAIASHEFKFLTAVRDYLEQDPSIELVIDTWSGQRNHREGHSRSVARKADVIFCEWCCGNAVWYSKHKKAGQKLIIRLHRFEYFTEFPKQVNIDKVDAVIVVSDFFKALLMRHLGWPAKKIIVEPQYVNAAYFDRPKQPGSEKTLGFVGIVAFNHKRFDRAVDVLERVLARDPDFKLRVRSRMPWEFPWAWEADPQAQYNYQTLFERIRTTPALRDAVIFDQPGADMGEWYRNVGFMLSTSETEGCHTSIAEGMASGAIPVLINWEGADLVYPADYVHGDTDEMADYIIEMSADQDRQMATSAMMAKEASVKFDVTRTTSLYGSFVD